jgi:teichuronic acid biosynthesis glycosyltransferase TuaC
VGTPHVRRLFGAARCLSHSHLSFCYVHFSFAPSNESSFDGISSRLRMRLVTFTNLYPSEDMPRHGIFVEERLRHLLATGDVEARVVALRPSLPGFRLKGRATEKRVGIMVDYLRVPSVPKLSNWIDPWTWAAAAESAVRDGLMQTAEPAILDAHFLYPDGVAAVILGQRLGLPVVISARGSDVNVKCLNPVMRKWVRWAAAHSSAVIAVSQALATRISELDIHPPILEVIPNGVDLERFRPRGKQRCRDRLGISGKVIASVGHLVDDKGHRFAIEALAKLADVRLLIVGEGPQKSSLQLVARKLGVADRVHFIGLVPHEDMSYVYSAADLLVLASAREGMPNVILESLACGTRVVATDVGGVAEVLQSDMAGALIADRSAGGLLQGIARVEAGTVPMEATRAYAARFGWGNVLGRQIALYRNVLSNFVH